MVVYAMDMDTGRYTIEHLRTALPIGLELSDGTLLELREDEEGELSIQIYADHSLTNLLVLPVQFNGIKLRNEKRHP